MKNALLNDVNEHIRIEIKNKSKRIIILFNKYADSNTAELTINNLKNKNLILNDQSIIIKEIEYNAFISKICKFVFPWEVNYKGEKDIEFNIKVNVDKIIKTIEGKGAYPPNWNDFIIELTKIEKFYNSKASKKETKIELINMEKLTDIIEELIHNPECCTLYNQDQDDEYSITESVPGVQLNNFIIYLENNNLFDEDYLVNFEKVRNKNTNDLTYEELLTYLTMIIKREALYPSSLYKDIKDGLLLKILIKIKDVIS